MKPCYYCGDKSVGVANDVPVCKHHQPEDKPTERKVQAADPVGPDWPYGVYDQVCKKEWTPEDIPGVVGWFRTAQVSIK